MQMHKQSRRSEHYGSVRIQPRVRMHEVLEARGRTVLAGCGGVSGQAQCVQERREAQDRGYQRGDSASCLQSVRGSHARTYREHEVPLLWFRFNPQGAVERARVGAARIRRFFILHHRIWYLSQRDAGYSRAAEGVGARTVRLPFARTDGCDCNPRREAVRSPAGLNMLWGMGTRETLCVFWGPCAPGLHLI